MYSTLSQLETAALGCTACRLEATRKNVVFGVGNPAARLMLIGEGPGQNEDEQGEPFVGRAGKLLDTMLLGAGFSRGENVYIANMVKCRPPENRDPEADEVAACADFLQQQIKLINPAVIVCLGRVAAQSLIDPKLLVTREHGKFILKDGIYMTATFHPAAILRNPNNKPAAFGDLLAVRDKLEELDKQN